MFGYIDATILGIVEGITEFLPISSTAHLILTADLLHIPESVFLRSFEIAVQSGAILAVVWLYFKKFLDPEVLKRLVVAFIPTGVLGLIFYQPVKDHLLGSTAVVLWALAIGGVLLILFERWHTEGVDPQDVRGVSYKQSAALGVFQAVAMIPGVSRSAATIVGGLLMKIPRRTIVEFSFLLAVPTMLVATGFDLLQSASAFSQDQFGVLAVGFVISFIASAASIRWLLAYVKKHDFTGFGVYRVVIALAFLVVLL